MVRPKPRVLVLATLLLFDLVSIYQTAFSLWMVSHPLYSSVEWVKYLTIWSMVTAALTGLLMFLCLKDWRGQDPKVF